MSAVCDRAALCGATRWPTTWEESTESEVFKCWPSVLGPDPQNSLQRVFSVYRRHGDDAFMDTQQKNEMRRSSFAERGPFCKSLPFFSCYPRTSLLQPLTCLLPPTPSPAPAPSCVYSKQLIRIADMFFPGVALTLISLLIPGQQSSVSEASLGFRDVDFDAVCALRGRVLAKGGSLFRSQQPLASLLPLLLR